MVHVQFESSKVCTRSNFGTCVEVFDSVINYVGEKIGKLNKEKSADSFIRECRELNGYLTRNRSDCNQCYGHSYQGTTNIDAAVKIYLETVTKFGGCPHPFTSEDAERIKLISDIEEFCEKKKGYIREIKPLKSQCVAKKDCSSSEPYKTKCSKYLEWLDERERYFFGKKERIAHFNNKSPPQVNLSLYCDVTKHETFENKDDICHKDKSEKQELKPIFLDGKAVDDTIGEDIRSFTLSPSSTGDLQYTVDPNTFNNKSDQTGNPLQFGNSINSETSRYERYYKIPEPTITGFPIPHTFQKTLPPLEYLLPQKPLSYQKILTPEENPPLDPKENQIPFEMVEPALPPQNEMSGYKLYMLIFAIISGVVSSSAFLMKNTPLGSHLNRSKNKKRKEAHDKINRVLMGLQSPVNDNVNLIYGGFSS
ncbi:PIR protein [Plasmodium vivax]|uniref:VIR protein n=1 Tax=Plasmodium vivax TaxID=5855 RepID=A0A565A641_PLAVI|nr:PIR protein [Plasmodium vivax]